MHFKIKSPIWKDRSVGLAADKLSEYNTVEIVYKDRMRVLAYPHLYEITREQAITYPTMAVKNRNLYVIPIAELKVKEYR